MDEYIPMDQLVDRHIYQLRSRNLLVGVWDSERKGFNGIREKFGQRYIFMEFHRDADGTAKPIRDLGELPTELINTEDLGLKCECGRAVEEIPGATSYPWLRHADDKTPMDDRIVIAPGGHSTRLVANEPLREFLEPYEEQILKQLDI